MLTELHTNPTQLAGLLAFAIAAAACFRAAARLQGSQPSVWRALAATQLAFLLEILFSLRHRVHDLVDALFLAQGWYGERSRLQVPLVCLALLLAVGAMVALFGQRGLGRPARAAIAASLVTLGSLVVEAISLHGIDALMYADIGPFKSIAGVWAACAAVVAVMAIRSAPGRAGMPPAFRR